MTRRAGHYTKRTAEMICEYIALGATLQQALAKVGYLAPSEKNFWKWIDQHEDFRQMYERARTMQADKFADELLELSQSVLQMPRANSSNVRVAADILKWQAERRNWTRYGSKGEEKASKKLNPQELRAEIKRLEAELGLAEKRPDGKPDLKAVG